MKVTLIAHTPEPEKVVATAAKLCYSSSDIATLADGLTEDKITSFVRMLAEIGHESPLEHVSFTFGIEGVSRSLTHQLVRHRIASYSQKSQRYVAENNFEAIAPREIEQNVQAFRVFQETMSVIKDAYDEIADILTEDFMKEYMQEGCTEAEARKKASKKAAENARAVLPNACETKIVVTMNVRSLLNFFKHRCCNRAQEEIRELAMRMYEICYEVAPNLFVNAGPTCVTERKCHEGKMCCGRANDVINRFTDIKIATAK